MTAQNNIKPVDNPASLTDMKATGKPLPKPPANEHRRSTPQNQRPFYRRGDVWYVIDNPESPPVGTELWANRPAVIISNNTSSNRSGFVQVIYLTTSMRKRTGPTHVPVGSPLNDNRESMALCEQIHTVDVSRLKHRAGVIPQSIMQQIDAAIIFSLSIGHNADDFSLFRKWELHLKTYGVDLAAEITALSAKTTDARVEALARALEIVTSERDSFRSLYESAKALPLALQEIRDAVTSTNSEEKNIG